jgi:hypothetical protein
MELWQIGLLVVLALVLIGLLIWKILFGQKTTNGYATNGHSPPESQCGYSVWQYREGVWVMTEDHSRPGYVPGPAPTAPPQFGVEVVRVTSVRRPRG